MQLMASWNVLGHQVGPGSLEVQLQNQNSNSFEGVGASLCKNRSYVCTALFIATGYHQAAL